MKLISFPFPLISRSARTGLVLLACTVGWNGSLSAQGTASSGNSPTPAQSQSFRNPWTGSLGKLGFQYDVQATVVSESNISGNTAAVAGNPGILTPTSDGSAIEVDGAVRILFRSASWGRYSLKLNPEGIDVGAWWNLSPTWLLGVSGDFVGSSEIEFGSRLTPTQSAAFESESTVDARLHLAKRMGDFTAIASIGDDNGLVGALEIQWDKMVSEKWRLSSSLGAEFGSSSFMQNRFGVTPSQSTVSGILPYTAPSGLRFVLMDIEAHYQLSKQWSFFTFARAEFLGSTARKSPLFGGSVTQATGDKGHWEAGVGLRFSF
jgi:hypothetical protein